MELCINFKSTTKKKSEILKIASTFKKLLSVRDMADSAIEVSLVVHKNFTGCT